jgi:protoporphyrinogen oxidase
MQRSTTIARQAIIIGAGPAGLTAALEFLRRTDVKPIVLEASQEIGGISRTSRSKDTAWIAAVTVLFQKATA